MGGKERGEMSSFVFTVTTMKMHLAQTFDGQKSVFSVISVGVDMENAARWH